MPRKPLPVRQTHRLHMGRWSNPNTRYFVTCRARLHDEPLTTPAAANAIHGAWTKMEEARDFNLLCATIMPNHIHVLLSLESRLSIGQTVGKFKQITKNGLSQIAAAWQRDYFEHHLHPDSDADPIARYIFLNPFRAHLIGPRDAWPHWHLNGKADFAFLSQLIDGHYPPTDWLRVHNQ